MKQKYDNFQALSVATQATQACVELADSVNRPFGDVVSQLTRAALSVSLNLTEGAGRQGKDRLRFYRMAYGSAREAMKVVELLKNLGRVPDDKAQTCLELLDRVGAMCWRLTH